MLLDAKADFSQSLKVFSPQGWHTIRIRFVAFSIAGVHSRGSRRSGDACGTLFLDLTGPAAFDQKNIRRRPASDHFIRQASNRTYHHTVGGFVARIPGIEHAR